MIRFLRTCILVLVVVSFGGALMSMVGDWYAVAMVASAAFFGLLFIDSQLKRFRRGRR